MKRRGAPSGILPKTDVGEKAPIDAADPNREVARQASERLTDGAQTVAEAAMVELNQIGRNAAEAVKDAGVTPVKHLRLVE